MTARAGRLMVAPDIESGWRGLLLASKGLLAASFILSVATLNLTGKIQTQPHLRSSSSCYEVFEIFIILFVDVCDAILLGRNHLLSALWLNSREYNRPEIKLLFYT